MLDITPNHLHSLYVSTLSNKATCLKDLQNQNERSPHSWPHSCIVYVCFTKDHTPLRFCYQSYWKILAEIINPRLQWISYNQLGSKQIKKRRESASKLS